MCVCVNVCGCMYDYFSVHICKYKFLFINIYFCTDILCVCVWHILLVSNRHYLCKPKPLFFKSQIFGNLNKISEKEMKSKIHDLKIFFHFEFFKRISHQG